MKPRMRNWLVGLTALALMVQLAACTTTPEVAPVEEPDQSSQAVESSQPQESQPEAQPDGEGAFTAGTYQSRQQGHNGFIEVEVTFSDTAITGIQLLGGYETPGVSTKATLTDLPNSIIETQTLNVDTITGATISSMAMLRAVEDCVQQAGGDPAALKPEKTREDPAEIEKSADLIIVGAGGSGLAAAVAATDNGASVILVEKVGYAGGNTMVAGGIYNAADPEMQKSVESSDSVESLVVEAIEETPVNDQHAALIATVREEYEAYKDSGETSLFDSPGFHALQTWNGGDKVADLALVEFMTSRALDCLHWVMDMGYEITPNITQGSGSLYQRTHNSVKPLTTGIIDAYMDNLEAKGVEIVYNTTAKEFVVTDGVVTGVLAEDIYGNTYTFTANKNVILTTGGFGGNAEMVQRFNTSGKWPDLSQRLSTNLPGITGDGIAMAENVGAALRDMDQIQLLQVCHAKTGLIQSNVYPKGVGGYLLLNQEGERFVREDGRRDDISLAGLDQTGGVYYLLQSAESIPDPDSAQDLSNIPLNDLIEMGEVLVADTLEEICALVDMDYENAQATIDAYNKVVDEGGTTDEFGRALFSQKFETGPWYVIPRSPSVHHTMGGVVINTDCQVLDGEGNPIPGLYAAGEVAGGIHGGNRLGGNAIVDTVVFGRTAGEQASK